MKILFTRFPLESAFGGAEVQTLSLMKGLMARGHAVAFLGSCPTLLSKCREEGIPTVELNIGPPPVSKFHALTFLWRKQRMQQVLEAHLDQFSNLDAICMLSLSEKILLTPAALAKNIPVLWIEHDRIGPWLTQNPWLKKLRELSARVTTVGVSQLSRKLYIDLGWKSDRVVAIPNGIDLERFSAEGNLPLSPDTFNSRIFPYPPTPFPEGERGDEEKTYKRKRPVNGQVLEFARDMRKKPTEAEEVLWQHLRFDQLGVRFRRQHPVGMFILDFYCHAAKLGIEVDGGIHLSQEQKERDEMKMTELLNEHGIRLMRFTNEEILSNPLSAVNEINTYIHSPHPSGEGLGVGEENIQTKPLHIGCIARLTEDKGVDVLIEAVADLPQTDLTIVGTGREEGFIRKLMEQHTDRIRLVPKVNDVGEFYHSLDVLVLPSREHDPFGLVAAEAMSLGIPVIVTNACGIASELTPNHDSILVEANNASALRQAIITMEDADVRSRLGEEGRKTAQTRFALQSMVEKYEKILLEMRAK